MTDEKKSDWETRPPLTAGDCIKGSDKMDWEGEILVINADKLKENEKLAKNSLWKALNGSGCRYTARGRAVLAECLSDGEVSYFDRGDFLGIVKTGILLEWINSLPVKSAAEVSEAERREEEMEVSQ